MAEDKIAAGIKPIEAMPGYKKVLISPHPHKSLDWIALSFDTRYGKISSAWNKLEDGYKLEIETPVDTLVIIDGAQKEVCAGKYTFFQKG